MNIKGEILKSEAVIPILSILKNHSLNGYQLLKALEAAHIESFAMNEGMLYVTLHALVDEKYLDAYWTDGSETQPSRRCYRTTSRGIKELEKRSAKEHTKRLSREKAGSSMTVTG